MSLEETRALIRRHTGSEEVPPPPPNSTENHTWFNHVGHILCEGVPLRVLIQEYTYTSSHGFAFHVKWRNKEWNHKHVSALYLAIVEYQWNAQRIVSDDSDYEDDIPPDYLSTQPYLGEFNAVWAKALPDAAEKLFESTMSELQAIMNLLRIK